MWDEMNLNGMRCGGMEGDGMRGEMSGDGMG